MSDKPVIVYTRMKNPTKLYKTYKEQSASEMPMQDDTTIADMLGSIELNPCSCGGRVGITESYSGNGLKYFCVGCGTCGLSTMGYTSGILAVRAWNEKTKKKLSAADAIGAILGVSHG
jgi:hypothetical protein